MQLLPLVRVLTHDEQIDFWEANGEGSIACICKGGSCCRQYRNFYNGPPAPYGDESWRLVGPAQAN